MLQIGSLALMSALQFNGNNQKWEGSYTRFTSHRFNI